MKYLFVKMKSNLHSDISIQDTSYISVNFG